MILWNKELVLNRAGIYIIRCKITGKKYIGKTKNIHRRWTKHLNDLKSGTHHNKELQRDVNEYGIHKFEFEVAELIDVCEFNPLINNIDILELVHIFKCGGDELYNVVLGKDIISFGVYNKLIDEYDVKIDFEDDDCLSNNYNPLKWNIVITSFMTGKKAYVHLISPSARKKTEYINENIEIREEFTSRHDNYSYVRVDFFNFSDYVEYLYDVNDLVAEIKKLID